MQEEVWSIVLIHSYPKMNGVVTELEKAFRINQKSFDHMISKHFGLDDLEGIFGDEETALAEQVIIMYQDIRAYDLSVDQLNNLIVSASHMVEQHPHLQDQLRALLRKSSFATKFYQLLVVLGSPRRASRTICRVATDSHGAKQITIQGPAAVSPKKVSWANSVPSEHALKQATRLKRALFTKPAESASTRVQNTLKADVKQEPPSQTEVPHDPKSYKQSHHKKALR